MKIIIEANADGSELQPLTEFTCKALLPIAGKPVILYLLESLYRADIREATVIAGPFADQLSTYLDGGTPWGMQLDIVSGVGTAEVFNNLNSSEELLILRGDVLADIDLREALSLARSRPGKTAIDRADCVGVAVLAHFNGRQPPLSLPARSINRLQSLQAYHQANMDVLHGRFVHLKAAGVELADGLYAEPGAKILKRSTDDCRIFIGNSSRLPADTEIEGAASIGNQVLIDRKVKMSNTVILPHTYLGAFTNLREAIVWGKVLIRIDTGVITQVEDTQLLADITPRNRRKKSGRCQSTRLFPNGFMRRVSKKLSSYVR